MSKATHLNFKIKGDREAKRKILKKQKKSKKIQGMANINDTYFV